ncbi:MAG: hypothetical protein MJY89_06380 [Bacteroidales bacterium]|nr:hypothetical protein [Bacteroidales bacterium]
MPRGIHLSSEQLKNKIAAMQDQLNRVLAMEERKKVSENLEKRICEILKNKNVELTEAEMNFIVGPIKEIEKKLIKKKEDN